MKLTMKASNGVRHGTPAVLTISSVALVACRQPDARDAPGGAPVPGASKAAAAPTVAADPDPVWHYEGDEGPEHWGTINAKFAACLSGRAQSPIDIVPAT